MKKLFLDFETRSACDLKRAGSWNYANHPTTEVLCAAYAFDSGPVELWKRGNPLPEHLKTAVLEGAQVVGHNFAGFDNYIWEKVWGFPAINPAQLTDTMSLCYAMSLPGSLEEAASALGLSYQKDMKAHRVMLQLSQPRVDEPLTWWTEEGFPEKFEMLYKYAARDIETTRELHSKLYQLSEKEKKIWLLDYEINTSGVRVDLDNVERAIDIVEDEQRKLNERIRNLTGNQISSAQAVAAISTFLKDEMGLSEKPSIARAEIDELLSKPGISDLAKEILLIRKQAAKASTAKFGAMLDAADPYDFRIRNCFAYWGAATGRWAGRKVQFHNLKRGKPPEGLFEAIEHGTLQDKFDSPLDVLSESLRGFVQAEPGKVLLGADFSSIEARMLAWLASEEKVLNVFRGHGKIYEAAAADIFGVALKDVTPEQRFIGKVAVLALGYGGGKKAFQKMAENYGLSISEEKADDIKNRWRKKHRNIVSYWYSLEDAALSAVRTTQKGAVFKGGVTVSRMVSYTKKGKFLWCRLPSGRLLCYPNARIVTKDMPWGDRKEVLAYDAVDSVSRKWTVNYLYGGLLAENVTQACARDIMAESMLRLSNAGFKIMLHVHDEIVCEVPISQMNQELRDSFLSLMTTVPEWAKELPIKADPWFGERYIKS